MLFHRRFYEKTRPMRLSRLVHVADDRLVRLALVNGDTACALAEIQGEAALDLE